MCMQGDSELTPIVYDLYCGLGGWTEGFLSEGYRCIGFDIEAHDYGTGGYPGELRIRDIRSIHGSELKDATCIVGSSPCQEFSYRAMPWKRAKALPPPYLGIELFNAQFRIQREAIEAAGHYIPMVVENVRGAQKWVGQARYHYGSFYLWGDVPALMPMTLSAQKFNPDGTAHPPGSWFAVADSKERGSKTPPIPQHPREDFGWNHSEELRAGRKTAGHANIRDGHTHTRHLTNPRESELLRRIDESGTKGGGDWFGSGEDCSLQRRFSGTKQAGISGPRNTGKGDAWFQDGAARHGSQSTSRKAASALIAKIPFPLSQHIARCFKPAGVSADAKVS